MFNYKAKVYERIEKPKKDNTFKQNAYEEIRKLVEDGEENIIVKEVKTKNKNNNENPYKCKLFDQIYI